MENNIVEITKERIDVESVIDSCRDDSCGAVCSFIGTVRNATKGASVTHLFFEAYEPMALKEMGKIIEEARKRWSVVKVSCVHRVGNVPIGEEAVVIAVSTPHRKDGFAACAYIIDTLKETVPIWKKEYLKNGEVWVSAHP